MSRELGLQQVTYSSQWNLWYIWAPRALFCESPLCFPLAKGGKHSFTAEVLQKPQSCLWRASCQYVICDREAKGHSMWAGPSASYWFKSVKPLIHGLSSSVRAYCVSLLPREGNIHLQLRCWRNTKAVFDMQVANWWFVTVMPRDIADRRKSIAGFF